MLRSWAKLARDRRDRSSSSSRRRGSGDVAERRGECASPRRARGRGARAPRPRPRARAAVRRERAARDRQGGDREARGGVRAAGRGAESGEARAEGRARRPPRRSPTAPTRAPTSTTGCALKTLQGLRARARPSLASSSTRGAASGARAADDVVERARAVHPERARRAVAVLRPRDADRPGDAGVGPGRRRWRSTRPARRATAGWRSPRRAAASGRTDDALADHVAVERRRRTTCRRRRSARSTSTPRNDVLYAGSGEPNGSSDSEAGLGPVQVDRLRRLVDAGARAASPVATNRAIGAIAVDPTDPDTIYIGTALARHGSSSVNGGRRTPPGRAAAGRLPVDRRRADVRRSSRTSPTRRCRTRRRPTPGSTSSPAGSRSCCSTRTTPTSSTRRCSATGSGGPTSRARNPTWEQVFHTMNQNDFTGPDEFIGDSTRRRDRVRLRRPRRRTRGSSSATPPTTGRSTATTRPRRRGRGATTTRRRSSATPTGICPPSDPMGDDVQHRQRLGRAVERRPGRPGLRRSTTTARTASAATTAWSRTRRARGRGRSGTWAR